VERDHNGILLRKRMLGLIERNADLLRDFRE